MSESSESGETPLASKQQATSSAAASAMSVWARIKEHKVAQWTLAYAAGAYTLLHSVEMVTDALDWPHLVVRILTLLLLLGLPLAATLAWFHGHRAQHRVSGSELAILAALLVLAAGVLFVLGRPAPEDVSTKIATSAPATSGVQPDAAVPHDASIAVLPFVNMSSDPEQEYFSDGMAEQVLGLLSRNPELRVIARTSSFAFKDKKDMDVAMIARRLNVAHVLEGSVRKAGKQVRISAQLIRSADSSQVWSETYDRELTDIFAVQDEIAVAVVRQLKVALLGTELPKRSPTANLQAYSLFLRARYLFDQHTDESMAKAVEYYQQALSIDPTYAEAWAGLGEAQAIRADEGFEDVTVGAREARASAQRALDLNPEVARAHYVLGMVQFSHDWDWFAAEASFKKAITLNPSEARALAIAGGLAHALGRNESAIDLTQRAVVHNPIGAYERMMLGEVYMNAGRLEDAEKEIRATLELYPEYAGAWYWLGLTLLLKGQARPALEAMLKEPAEDWRLAGLPLAYQALHQTKAADAALREEIEKHADSMAYQIAQAYAYGGEVDEAFAWLDRAYRQRDSGLAWYPKIDPLLKNISNDSRYRELLRKLKLPET